MAYLGTTAATTVSNPPVKMFGAMGDSPSHHITGGTTLYISNTNGGTAITGRGFGQQMWLYHTTDMTSAVLAANYFTDAQNLGMRPGDICFFVAQGTTVGSSQMLRIAVVSSVSSAGAAFSTASVIQGTS